MPDPLKTGFTRVFLIEGRARADRAPSYQSSMRMMGIDYAFGDIEDIKVPHPSQYDKFKTVGQIRGEEERPTTTLQGLYAIDLRSELLRLAKIGCAFDVQLHMGQCTDPSVFDEFEKIIILEDVLGSSFTTDDLGALSPDERAKVMESLDISAAVLYEVVPINASEVAGDIITNEGIDVAFCDTIQCGECGEVSSGCNRAFIVTKAAGGSPGTPADVVFSVGGLSTWYAHDVDTLDAAEEPDGIACVGIYVVVVSADSGSLHYAEKDEFDGAHDPAFTEVTTGFNAAGGPRDIWSVGPKAFIVGDGGYIYICTDPPSGVTEVDAGNASNGDDLYAVHALDENFAVAAGANGAVVYTEDGQLWTAVTRPVGVGIDIHAVFARNEDEWWVGTNDGRAFYTLNKGETWTEKDLPGSLTAIYDIAFPSDSVGYIAGADATPRGKILRTYNAGHTWKIIPEGTQQMPANDRITAIAPCWEDPNIVVGAGLADDGADGFAVVCQD